MSILADDPLTQLSFSVHQNKGVFALLLGSGLSRAAGIPTGWEVTLNLIRRVALAQGVEEQTDWAAWYRKKTGQEPDYSALLEELGASPEERRSILHGYIEPTDEDREEGRKVPTAAHEAIADLIQSGHIRVVITTNFDRLLENALRERGVEPTVVASADALEGAEPLTHTSCYILKLHGDYKDARILNTDAELSAYPEQYDIALDRILDEHGLIVCGWSGEWDHALRAAFLRAPNRRYTVYWASRGAPKGGADELIKHRAARLIPISDADSFFEGLRQRVETLEESQRQDPLSVDLQVGSAKRFLAKPEYRIQLDQLFADETDRLLTKLESSEFSAQGSWDQAQFRNRIARYNAACETLACMVGVLGRWGDGTEFRLVLDVIRSLSAHADKVGSGLTVLLGLRSYPAVLIFTAYGLGLVRAERWDVLHQLYSATIDKNYGDPERIVDSLFLWAWGGSEQSVWQQMEGMERHKTPFSDYLLSLFSDWGKRFIGLTPDFELMFERFEFLGSLVHLEQNEKAHIEKQLAEGQSRNFAWMPVGRSGWNGKNAQKLIAEILVDSRKDTLANAGFGKRDPEFIDVFVENFRRVAGQMRW